MRLYTKRLADSLGSVNSDKLARDFLKENPLDARAWLDNRSITLLGDKAVNILEDLYYESAWVGTCIGRAEIGLARKQVKAKNPDMNIDWEGWEPGDAKAARLLTGNVVGLKGLLDKAKVTISGIDSTRLDQLGNVLSRSVGAGLSMGSTAAAIRTELGTSTSWSRVVAQTETRRAVTAASLDTYRSAQITEVEWLTSDGGCELCASFEAMGPVPIGEGFGDTDGPPAHPNCFCTILPVVVKSDVIEPREQELEPDIIVEDTPVPQVLPPVADDKIPQYYKDLSPADEENLVDWVRMAAGYDDNRSDRYGRQRTPEDWEIKQSLMAVTRGTGRVAKGLQGLMRFTGSNNRFELMADVDGMALLKAAPKKSGTFIRGMAITPDDVDLYLNVMKEGHRVDGMGVSSWTLDESVAGEFADWAAMKGADALPGSKYFGKTHKLHLHADDGLSGIPVESITRTPNEWETVTSGDFTFQRAELDHETGILHVWVTERRA